MSKNVVEEKSIRYANGIIKHFNAEGERKSLYFKGKFVDSKSNEAIVRNIKLSKKIQGFEFKKNDRIDKKNFPLKDHIYKGSLMLETWEWEGHSCMRVLAFEIEEDLGVNRNYANGELISPFSKLDSQEKN